MRAWMFSGLVSATTMMAGLLTGCAAESGDATASSDDDLIIMVVPIVSGTAVSASGSSLAISYVRTAALTPVTITLTGPAGAVTLSEQALAGGRYGATFTGLAPCTAYRYAIDLGTTVLDSGNANTLSASGTPCPLSERLKPSHALTFRGVHHDNACGGANPAYAMYPLGTGWASAEDGGLTTIEVGYDHYYYPGSGLVPCPESYVNVYRSELTWSLTDVQVRRATAIHLTANYATLKETSGGPAACVSDVARMLRTSYPITTVDTAYHDSAALPGPAQAWGLERENMITATSIVNGALVANLTAQKASTISVGFANGGDGFGSLNAVNPGFATDNDACLASISDIGLDVTYADMPPNTPHECSLRIVCNDATVTCDASPDLFELVRVNNDGTTIVDARVDMRTTNAAPVMHDIGTSTTKGWKVCTTSSLGTQCTGVLKPSSNTCTVNGI